MKKIEHWVILTSLALSGIVLMLFHILYTGIKNLFIYW
jgi:hypothetical protein